MKTLYERLGGGPALDAAVTEFYRRVLDDTLLAPLFDGIDSDRLHQHQQHFLALATGGPNAYVGRDLGSAHRHLVKRFGLCDADFDRVVLHLGDSLAALGVDPGAREEVLALAESVRDAVLGRAVVALA